MPHGHAQQLRPDRAPAVSGPRDRVPHAMHQLGWVSAYRLDRIPSATALTQSAGRRSDPNPPLDVLIDAIKDTVDESEIKRFLSRGAAQRADDRARYLRAYLSEVGKSATDAEIKDTAKAFSLHLPVPPADEKKTSSRSIEPPALVRSRTLEERQLRLEWKVGAKIQVFSASGDGWFPGTIERMYDVKSSAGVPPITMVSVSYLRSGVEYTKDLERDSTGLLPVGAPAPEDEPQNEEKTEQPSRKPKSRRAQSHRRAAVPRQSPPTVSKPPSAREQRHVIERMVKETGDLQVGDTRCLVPFAWFTAWKGFTAAGGSEGSAPAPGPLLVTSLLDEEVTDKIRRGVRAGCDFVALPENAFEMLLSWYGGHPALRRTAKRVGVLRRRVALDLYPVTLVVALTDASGQLDPQSERKIQYLADTRIDDVRLQFARGGLRVERPVIPPKFEIGERLDAKDEYGKWFPGEIVMRWRGAETRKIVQVEIAWHDPRFSDPKFNEKIETSESHRFARYGRFSSPGQKGGLRFAVGDFVVARDYVQKKVCGGELPEWNRGVVNKIDRERRHLRVNFGGNTRSTKREYWFHDSSDEIQHEKDGPVKGSRFRFDDKVEIVELSPSDTVRLWIPHSSTESSWALCKPGVLAKRLDEVEIRSVLIERVNAKDGAFKRHVVTRRWRDFEIGDEVDANDTEGTWLQAEVINIRPRDRPTEVLIHYTGWGSKYDEYISVDSARLARRGSKAAVRKQRSNMYGFRVGRPKSQGVVGLFNLGNTCYLNSILQCLSNCRDFTEYFLDEGYRGDLRTDGPSRGRMASAMRDALHGIWSNKYTTIVPRKLKAEAGRANEEFSGLRQQDSQSLLLCLFDRLHSDLNRASEKQRPAADGKRRSPRSAAEYWQQYQSRYNSIVSDLFEGVEGTTMTCLYCKNQQKRYSTFNTIMAHIPKRGWSLLGSKTVTLEECLKMYTKKEVLHEINCEKCKCKRSKSRVSKVERLPEYFVVHLGRFALGWLGGKKVTDFVDFPLRKLRVDALLGPEAAAENKGITYDLVSVSNHYGTCMGGHYTAFGRNPMDGEWYLFNDDRVTSVTQKDYIVSKEAYVLFYKKVRPE